MRGPRTRRAGTAAITVARLRSQWRERSESAGWTSATDWAHPAVDAICETLVAGQDPWAAAERLGAVRADYGAGLAETLADIDALAFLVAPDLAEILRRAVSLGWADRATSPDEYLCDPLTGLTSAAYLQVRLAEIYRGAVADGRDVDQSHHLVVVRVAGGNRGLWQRALPLILVGEALRTVFDRGQTLTKLSDTTAVALVERDPQLPRRARLTAALIDASTAKDAQLRSEPARVWLEALPANYRLALSLLQELTRS